MTGRLQGKVALVTGGGSGIGRATALAFGREGAKVVVADIAVDGGSETVKMVREGGNDALFVQADVTLAVDVKAMVSRSIEAYGRLDCAYNNAGFTRPNRIPTHEYPEEDWDLLINVNLKGVWQCMKYEVPQMMRQGHGSIVNASSICGLVGTRGTSAYIAAKHGVVGLTRAAALEYAREGIRVNAVCPSYTLTPLAQRVLDSDPDLEARFTGSVPMSRMGTPEEIAETVVWLCSDAASFVTGHAVSVDGGYVAQ